MAKSLQTLRALSRMKHGHLNSRDAATKEEPLYPAGVKVNEDEPAEIMYNISTKEEPLYPAGMEVNANVTTEDDDGKLYPSGVMTDEATTKILPRPDRAALRVLILEQLENRGGLQRTCQLMELAEKYFIYKLTNNMNFVEESFRVPYSWTDNGLAIHWSREAPLTAPAILEPVAKIEGNASSEQPLMPNIVDAEAEKNYYKNKFKEENGHGIKT